MYEVINILSTLENKAKTIIMETLSLLYYNNRNISMKENRFNTICKNKN